ncbi:MAG: uncharacterized protein JWN06_2612 [Propionibacteriaceae bacterium]|jgi:uncharacterized protein (DUF305 family)|nr:uncharacterized protein [Propionibacteriaceae bacterium]
MTAAKLKFVAPALVLAVAQTACGCSGGHDTGSEPVPAVSTPAPPSAASTSATGPHNEADVTFATMMIPHHAQAIEIANLMLIKSVIDPDVSSLAQRIKAAQEPEISQLRGWLAGWGASQSSPTGDHGHGGDDGMLGQGDLDALEAADGTEATRLFLKDMVKHHEGAIAMAETELTEGVNPAAKRLAQTIIDTQRAEIDEMKQLPGG